MQQRSLRAELLGMNESARLYYSERHIPLVYVGQPTEKVILTVENYMKWYYVYEILPSGAVRPANLFDGDASLKNFEGPVWSDHVPNPEAVARFADHYGYEVDENALDMIQGRWDVQRDCVRTLVACAGCEKGIIPKYKHCQDCMQKEIARLELLVERNEDRVLDLDADNDGDDFDGSDA